ncbi:MAG: beta-aspartyl-peptidase [Alkaliphilus sp.]
MWKLIKKVSVYSPKKLGVNDILIYRDKIVQISTNIEVKFFDLEIIDGDGKIAVPGYIDQHVHITGGGGEGGCKTRVPETMLSECTTAGVTTVVGLLGTDAVTRSIENLVAKTKALNEEGITAYCVSGSYEYPSVTLTGDIKKDIVYIQEIIGVKIAISDHRATNISKKELARLVLDVRRASLISKKPGVVHIHVGNGADKLNILFDILKETEVPIKHLRPTHVKRVLSQAIEFAKLGGYIDFTTTPQTSVDASAVMSAIESVPLDKITLSSDANGSSPKWNEKGEMVSIAASSMKTTHELIKFMIKEKKLDITTALSLVTSNVAKAIELFPVKGVLAESSDADILLLDDDFEIRTVIAKGRIMIFENEIRVKGTYEN